MSQETYCHETLYLRDEENVLKLKWHEEHLRTLRLIRL